MKETIMFKRFALFVLLFSLLFVVGMAAAQDAPLETNTPLLELTATLNGNPVEATLVPPPDTAPVPDTAINWQDYLPTLFNVIAVLVIGLVLVSGTALVLLYRSFPPVLQGILGASIGALIKQYEERSKETPDDLDDKIAAKLQEMFDKFMSQVSLPVAIAQQGQKLDQA
jgi:hypothetical protein